jgi:hypothetical protein
MTKNARIVLEARGEMLYCSCHAFIGRTTPPPDCGKGVRVVPFGCDKCKAVDYSDPKWRYDARVKRLIGKGRTKEEAEEVVKMVITTKEQD